MLVCLLAQPTEGDAGLVLQIINVSINWLYAIKWIKLNDLRGLCYHIILLSSLSHPPTVPLHACMHTRRVCVSNSRRTVHAHTQEESIA